MNSNDLNNFMETRDDVLNDIKQNPHEWNKFIVYWSKQLDKYSIDH